MVKVCDIFQFQSKNAYQPLVCKDIVATTRTIGGRRQQNRNNYFFLMKPNTIRENATIDLLYPTPLWLKLALQKVTPSFALTTNNNEALKTIDNFLLVTTG